MTYDGIYSQTRKTMEAVYSSAGDDFVTGFPAAALVPSDLLSDSLSSLRVSVPFLWPVVRSLEDQDESELKTGEP